MRLAGGVWGLLLLQSAQRKGDSHYSKVDSLFIEGLAIAPQSAFPTRVKAAGRPS